MKKRAIIICLLAVALGATAQTRFGKGWVTVKKVARNAVRIQYSETREVKDTLPDWVYVKHDEVKDCGVSVDTKGNRLTVRDAKGRVVLTALRHELADGSATLAVASPQDE